MTSLLTLLLFGFDSIALFLPSHHAVPLSAPQSQLVLPYVENFDNGFPALWVNELSDGPEDWLSSDSVATTYGPDATDHTTGIGNYLWVDDSSPHSATVSLVSPCFNLSGTTSPQLKYWLWSVNENPANPDVLLHMDVESNGVWTTDIVAPIGSQGAGWTLIQEDLSAFAGTLVRIRFRASETSNGFQHDMAIDDFSLTEPGPVDLGVVALPAPLPRGCFGTAEPITVAITNFGTAPVDFSTTTVSVGVHVSGASNQTLSAPISAGLLAPGATQSYVLATTIDLSASGTHFLALFTGVAGDANSLNDTLFTEVAQEVLVLAPLFEDFETFATGTPATLMNGWVQAPDDDRDWSVEASGIQQSTGTGPIDDHSPVGNQYLYTEATAPSQTGDVFDLLSPCVDVGALGFPALSFWYHMYGEEMGRLEVAVRGSSGAWTPVFSVNGEQQTAETAPWRQAVVPIVGLGDTVQLRFRGIRGSGYRSDLALDDVRIDELPAQDLTPVALISPGDPACPGPAETIAVSLRNLGGTPIQFANTPATVTVDISGPLPQTFTQPISSGTLAPFGTLQTTVTGTADFSQQGTYTLTIRSIFPGDGNAANDTLLALRHRIVPDTLPLDIVHFSNYTGSNLSTFFPGWREAEGAGMPTGTFSSWSADDFANDPFSLSGLAARMRFSGNDDQDWILSPSFVATAQTVLAFRIALTQAFTTSSGQLGSDDSLSILVSTDCGASFSPVFTYGSATAISNTGQNETIDLSAFAGAELLIGFYASEGLVDDPNDVDLFLDNIHLKEAFANDLGLVGFKGLESSCNLGSSTPITVTFTNAGMQAISGTFASFSVDGGPFSPPELLVAPAPGDTTSHTFAATANLAATGPHTIQAVISATGATDLNAANDTLLLELEHLPVISTFPYLERFENGSGSWFASGYQSSWDRGTPAKKVISGAASGQHAWTTGGLDTLSHRPLERSYVASPCFDFTQFGSTPWVSLKVWWESEFSWDGAVLQSSIDGGSNWTLIGEFGDPDNWYTDNTINSKPGGSQTTGTEDGWSGRDSTGEGSGGWVLARHELNPALLNEPSVQFRIAFAADATFEYDGFAFDDFGIGELPTASLGAAFTACPTGDSLDAGSFSSYLWSTGDTTRQLALLNPTGVDIIDSLIWVQITDSLGLEGRDTIRVTIRATGPTVNVTPTASPACPDDSTGAAVAFYSGNGPFTAIWNTLPPQSGPIASGLPQGTYTLTVTDNLGCSTVDTVEIPGPAPLSVHVDTLLPPLCPGDATGQLSITASGGTSPYSYAWSNGAVSEDLTSLLPGNYSLTLTDANGCVWVNAPLALVATDSLPVADFGFSLAGNATVDFTENASANATSYAWDFGDGQGTSSLPDPSYTYSANGSFPVTLIVSGSCGADTFTRNVLLTRVSIDAPLLSQVSLYPNPNDGRFVVAIEGAPMDAVQLRLHDVWGRLLFSQQTGPIASDVQLPVELPAGTPSGLYFLEVRSTTGSKVFRFRKK